MLFTSAECYRKRIDYTAIEDRERRLRVLLTNVGIANRTGTEIVAMDLACGLARLGHRPMIWAPLVDPLAAAPALTAGIPVVQRLEDLPFAPDVIHGHHHLETVQALQQFPDTPAIFVCHSGYWWHDAPPRHPRLLRYVAVDEFCRDRLSQQSWIQSDRISVIWNAVDLDRHRPRPPLPETPWRALIFSHYAGAHTHAEPIREACGRRGIPVDTVGGGAGNPTAEPERLLGRYDLVFAKARCAIEAMATGCAVILCDTSGLGEMVRSSNISELQRWNFGFRVLQRPLDPQLIESQIQRYDSNDAKKVSGHIRETAGLDGALQRYLALYRSVLEERPTMIDGSDWHPVSRPIQIEDQAALHLRFVSRPEFAGAGEHLTFKVALDNQSSIPVATSAPWPCLLMTRWLDARTGKMVVEHGFRTILQPPALPGAMSVYPIRAIAPREAGDYTLRVTIVQEGWRWLDHLSPAVSAEARVVVAAERFAPLSLGKS